MSAVPFAFDFDDEDGDEGTEPLFRPLLPLRDGDPRRLGRYVLTNRVAGGNSDTAKFLAWDGRGRQYLLKVLFGADDVVRWRMQREVRSARRLSSPRVAPVLGHFEEGEYSYIVQRFIVGPTLRGVLEEVGGPLPVRDLWRLALGLAKALADVKAADLVHGDPTPVNVIVAKVRVVLVDLGASRCLGEVRPEVYGTPYYVAPEQLDGQDIEPPTDVFIWALTVAEAGTGHRPFDPTGRLTAEQYAIAVRSRQPALDGLPGELRAVLSDALSTDPATRPSIEEVVARLEAQLRRGGGTTHSLTRFTQVLGHPLVDRTDEHPLVPLTPTWRELLGYGYWQTLLQDYRREVVHRLGTRWSAVAVGAFLAFLLAGLSTVVLIVAARWVLG